MVSEKAWEQATNCCCLRAMAILYCIQGFHEFVEKPPHVEKIKPKKSLSGEQSQVLERKFDVLLQDWG
jgi:hypothetical protein